MEIPGICRKRIQLCPRQRIDARLNVRDSIFLERVGNEPGFHSGRSGFSLVQQFLEHRDHTCRTDAGANDVVESFDVRFSLILPAEAREQCCAPDVNSGLSSLVVADAGEDAGERDPDVGLLLLLNLLHRMAANDVSDFVAEYACELVHLVGSLNESAIHVDESAGKRECVHFLAIDDVEMPVQIRATGQMRDGIAQDVDIAIDFNVPDNGKLGVDLLRVLLAHLNFFLLRNGAGDHGQ